VIPRSAAASRIVVSFATVMSFPSIVRLTISVSPLDKRLPAGNAPTPGIVADTRAAVAPAVGRSGMLNVMD
jgi:hypothetical protein